MIKTVIFDIDNTLYDCNGLDAAVTEECLLPYVKEHFGWTLEGYYARLQKATEELIGYAGCTGACRDRCIRFQLMLEEEGLPLSPHVLNMYETYWNNMLSRMEPYPGAEDVMAALKARGIRIGVCTDLTSEIQYRKLKRLRLLSYVDFMVTSAEAGWEKPDPAMFRRSLMKAEAQADECLFVGDNYKKDILGAQAAGMHALWMNTQHAPEAADVTVIRELSEIMDRIQKDTVI